MKSCKYTVKDVLGIHARPAGILVKQAMKFPGSIKITAGTRSADAKRLLSILGMAVKCGEIIELTFEGEGEDAAVGDMLVFLKENL